ncbi:MAG: nucleotidyltransferase [Bacteroidota bacterium]
MIENWDNEVKNFIHLCDKEGVRMLMVGGGAVNFHGYQRHSADVDFWLETTADNFKRLVNVFSGMGYDIDDFPDIVKKQQQNISVKFSPASMEVELITNFSVNRPFDEVYNESVDASLETNPSVKWKVLNFEDLITSKVKAGRPKDLLDIQQLREIKK